jgi:DNA replication protein DnaC
MEPDKTHPDIMGEALGRFSLPDGNTGCKVIPLHRPSQDKTKILGDRLKALGLDNMADALMEQSKDPDIANMPFEERLSQLLDYEQDQRQVCNSKEKLKKAGLPYHAHMTDVDYTRPRGLVKSLMTSLASCGWLLLHHNVLITGPDKLGKTYLGCALARQACDMGFSVLYKSLPELFKEFDQARTREEFHNTLAPLLKTSLLILDNLGSAPISQKHGQALMRILDQRQGCKSVLAISQFKADEWPEKSADPVMGKALAERLVPNAYQINLSHTPHRKKANSGGAAMAGGETMSLDTDY